MDGPRVRESTARDLPVVAALDQGHVGRSELLESRSEEGRLVVADLDGDLVGYAAMGTFLEYDFLELLFVRPSHRRRGVGTALMAAVESKAHTPKLFTSTNQSNAPMQRLCERLGFEKVGQVGGLDEDDPELFYLKRLQRPAATPPTPRLPPAAPPGGRARRSRQSKPT